MKLKNVVLSAFYGALGPYFNKQATLDETRAIPGFFTKHNLKWMLYIFNILCIFLMLFSNTVSVKYKMLSYKFDGAFIGTTMIFILGYLFSSCFDYIYNEEFLPLQNILGALLIILGVTLISMSEQDDKMNKQTNSIDAVKQEVDQHMASRMPELTDKAESARPQSSALQMETVRTVSDEEAQESVPEEMTKSQLAAAAK